MDLIDPTLVRLVEYQELYREALIDAVTYRRMFLHMVDLHFRQAADVKRLEHRLRQVMGVEPWEHDEGL